VSIYSKKQNWKVILFICAMLIVAVSLWYTNLLVKKIAREETNKVKLWADAIQKKANLFTYTDELFKKIKAEERKRIEIWANATKMLSITETNADLNFYLDVVKSNNTIPVILTDDMGNINSWLNLDSIHTNRKDSLTDKEKDYLQRQLKIMGQNQKPIEIDVLANKKNYLYYNDSKLFSQIRSVLDDLIKSFISEVVLNSASVPVIYTNGKQDKVLAYGSIDTTLLSTDAGISKLIADMSSENLPLEVEFGKGEKRFIFYKDSYLLTQLKYYPLIQFGIIGIFLLIAYTLFSTARKAEQNQVWVGMAKETAHQLGTPLSSLMAWLELYKEKGKGHEIVEIEKDIQRLETITERFSKIGSQPVLQKENINTVLAESINYMRSRTSNKVSFTINSRGDIMVPLNVPLFEWAVENLVRNAVDAMNGIGAITIDVSDQTQFVYIDISDTGKGIGKSKFKTIFEPGFTTKKRGWGLGLSLTRRIIENYHMGKIFVKNSEVDKGTTFRIVLNK
jgi:two-component system, sporulation sensor kinase D